jgi:S-adenosylmethionine decarboxylase
MEALCVLAANAAGATIVDVIYKKFEPQGLTILIMLEESHLSIHTYPEHGFVAFDCYTCSYLTQPGEAVSIFESILKPKQVISKFIDRGILPN